jgi:hypothetical protein
MEFNIKKFQDRFNQFGKEKNCSRIPCIVSLIVSLQWERETVAPINVAPRNIYRSNRYRIVSRQCALCLMRKFVSTRGLQPAKTRVFVLCQNVDLFAIARYEMCHVNLAYIFMVVIVYTFQACLWLPLCQWFPNCGSNTLCATASRSLSSVTAWKHDEGATFWCLSKIFRLWEPFLTAIINKNWVWQRVYIRLRKVTIVG